MTSSAARQKDNTVMSDNARESFTNMPPVAALLGALGVLPFAVAAVLAISPETRDFGRWAIIGYGAVILSFLGGVQWGLGLRARSGGSAAMIVSNGIALTGWLALLVSPALAIPALAVGFLAAFAFDLAAKSILMIPTWFIALRGLLTASVVASLLLAYLPFLDNAP